MTNLKTKSITQLLADENPAGLFYLRNDIIEYTNKSFAEIFKTSPEQLVGNSIFELVHKSDRPLLDKNLSKLRNKEIEKFEGLHLKVRNNSKETVYFSVHLKTVSLNNGNIEIAGASRNATKRVKSFNELEINKSKFEVLYKNSLQGIIFYNFQLEKIIDVNKKALEELGYEDDYAGLIKLSRFDLTPKTSKYFPTATDIHKILLEHRQRVLNNEIFYTPGIFQKKNGDKILVHVNVVPSLKKHGDAFIIFNNITEKILSKKALKTSEEKYRNIFENSHEGILYFNLKTRSVEICNQNALKLLGVNSLKELKNSESKDFYYDQKINEIENTQFTLHIFKKALREGRTEVTFKLKQQTGSVIWVSAVLISDYTHPQKPYIIAFLRNTNELYEAQDLLKHKNTELRKYIDSNLQLENFAFFASHDLQTPLRSIISFTQLLQLKLAGKLSKEEGEYMNFIISATKNMKDLVTDLLTYSSINKTQIKLKEIQVFKCLNELMVELNELIKENKATINLENINQNIQADPIKIRQVFQNLITNAIKFTIKGNKPIIKIIGSENANKWIFSVADNGIGIDDIYKEKIFLLFKRLHSNEYEGTGIGLALVKKIIDQHNGEIWFTSEQNRGTTFYFSIPKFPKNKPNS